MHREPKNNSSDSRTAMQLCNLRRDKKGRLKRRSTSTKINIVGKEPLPEQASCSHAAQLDIFLVPWHINLQKTIFSGWAQEAKSNGETRQALGKRQVLTATKPPGVTLVDGEMYKEITEPRCNHKKVT